MSSDPSRDPSLPSSVPGNATSPPPTSAAQPASGEPAASSPVTPIPEGGLASIVRKSRATGEESASDAGSAPTNRGGAPQGFRPGPGGGGGRGPRGGGAGPQAGQRPRKAKPAGGDAPGDDGERADYASREASTRSVVPVPSKRAPLSDDLEAELQAALGGMSLEAIAGDEGVKRSAEGLERESRHRGQVMGIHGDNVFVSLGGRHEGVASLRLFKEPPPVGEMIDVVVSGLNRDDGLYELSVPGGPIVSGDWSDLSEGSIVEARVTGANTGGLECAVNSLKGFIPAGQISIYRVENLGEFVGQKLVCVVMEANERRGNLVLSRRAVLEREKAEAKEKLLRELEPGQTREGVVRKIMDFGAFVDIGGVDGLLHIAQLSWERIKHPSEVLTEGQKINVRVEKIDPDTGKISLGYKNEADHPWKEIESKFPTGSAQKGTVSRIAEFGAFVKLAPGVEGLIHISELAHHRVYAVKNIVKEGDEVEVKVLSVDSEQQRMSLSLKATQAPPVKKDSAKKDDLEPVDEPPRESAVPKRQGPLKGGVGRKSGGEEFGLKW
jgi:small subunit ribosomal protein S1